MKYKLRIMISGGGTAGHIYPAIATADALREAMPGVEILFVGAQDKMEMQRVPQAGYPIVGLPVAGLQRHGLLSWHNLKLPFKVLRSLWRARSVVRQFRPDVVVGFGGYASAPVLRVAQARGIPTVIQEQNSYAGLTNRLLGKRAKAICVAYEGMERFFPEAHIVPTGNPLRGAIHPPTEDERQEAYRTFGLDPARKTLLVVGGSLGTKTLNQGVLRWLDILAARPDVQLIWQNGQYYDTTLAAELKVLGGLPANIWRGAFIERMDLAYAVADVVVARAGAGTVSELELVGRPVIFVPSPNVAEDHQTKNAQALEARAAALLIPDAQAVERVIPAALELLDDIPRREEMVRNIRALSRPDAAHDVAQQILNAVLREGFAHAAQTTPAADTAQKTPIYFIGIGGIGMSALARYFRHEGHPVAGYDRTPSPLTQALEKEGIAVHYEDSISLIPSAFRNPEVVRVVYTPAVPEEMSELVWFREQGFEVIKRSRMLGLVGEGKRVMAVAGTHGKTTTTTMLAWFNAAGAGEGSAFLGGISKNFDSNLVLGKGSRLAIEADEFDRSFLQLHPACAVITSVDADHLDIYGSYEAVREAFEAFVAQIDSDGALVLKKGISLAPPPRRKDLKLYTYAVEDATADFWAENLSVDAGGYYTFDLVCPDRRLERCRLGIPGLINVENCVAAVSLVWQAGFDDQKLKKAISSFRGVDRRFDFWVNTPEDPTKIVYMDDYAHHPAELCAMLTSVQKMFPGRRITIAFQPHLYTRTRDFSEQFSEALALADNIWLLPIYPAREEPIAGVDSALIVAGMKPADREKTTQVSKEELLEKIALEPLDVLVTAGAGDIDRLCSSIAEEVKKRNR